MNNEILLIKIDNNEYADLYPDIVSLEAEEDDQLASVFNIRLAIRQQKDGTWTWIDDQRLSLWNAVTILAGFANNTVEVIAGYITQMQPYFNDDLSKCYLDVKGMDGSVFMNTEEKISAWPNKKDSDIATQIFKNYSLKPNVEDTKIVHDEAISTIIQRETDIQFLKRLARRNGFECYIRNGTGFFQPPVLTNKPQKTLALQFGADSNLTYFQIETNGLKPTQVEMQQFDLLTREKRAVSISSTIQAKLGKTSGSGLYSAQVKPAKTYLKHALANNQPTMQLVSQGVYNNADWFLTGVGEINGTQYQDVLKAHDLVTIKGIGKIFSGKYYVTKVKHVFTNDGYRQYFNVKRNAINPDGTENFS